MVSMLTSMWKIVGLSLGQLFSQELILAHTSTLKQQSAARIVAPLGHIILIPSKPVFVLSPQCCVLSRESTPGEINSRVVKKVPSFLTWWNKFHDCEIDSTDVWKLWIVFISHELCTLVSFKSLTLVYFRSWTQLFFLSRFDLCTGDFALITSSLSRSSFDISK
jgi:hypothetical protein